jgi:hypothetical protein
MTNKIGKYYSIRALSNGDSPVYLVKDKKDDQEQEGR